ncbi:hypothetical protein BLGI_2686 [Brevibacillus laterosporus GI-9]|nr:hypothetical protein BLGI_2686 [Brevibacillus laterosporus GI-9]
MSTPQISTLLRDTPFPPQRKKVPIRMYSALLPSHFCMQEKGANDPLLKNRAAGKMVL